jgi:hypothetical protein
VLNWARAGLPSEGCVIMLCYCYVMVPLLPQWSQPARPGGALSHCLSGALSVSISITLR